MGNAAPSLSAGDASGVVRGLGDGESAATRAGRAVCVEGVRAGVAINAAAGDDVSSVTGMGTAGGAGSSNAPHGSSSSAVLPQPAPTALGPPPDCTGALSNASAAVID